MIEFNHVSKSYQNEVKAVDDLSFQINDGEIVGFIGPNGAGKTTTIKMLTGILPQEEGEIKVQGFDMKKQALEAKKCIGYIGDNPDVFLRLKGIEFLNFIADVYEVGDEREERIMEYAKRFDLTDALNKHISSYSHGMRQKMLVLAALIHEPDVLILDEPLTGLDPKSAYILKTIMKEHKEQGHSVFFSTHVLEVAESLCDRIVVIQKGKKIYEGTLEELTKERDGENLEQIFLELTDHENI